MTRRRSEVVLAVELSAKPKSTAFRHARLRRFPRNPVERTELQHETNWIRDRLAFLRRHIVFGEDLGKCARALSLPDKVAHDLVGQCEWIGTFRLALRFKLQMVPQLPASRAERAIVELILARLTRLSSREPRQVQLALENYVRLAHKDGKLNLTKPVYAAGIRSVIQLVKQLRIPQLRVCLVGFKVNGNCGDLRSRLRLLRFPADYPIRYIQAPNQKNEAALRHLAVEFCWQPSGKRSEALAFVFSMAVIGRLWAKDANRKD